MPTDEAAPLYKKPLTPELAATLAAMAEKRAAPKKPKKASPKKRKPKPDKPAYNAHVLARIDHRQKQFLADFWKRVRTPTPEPSKKPPLGPEGWDMWADTPQATSMGPGFSPPGIRRA